MFHWRKRRSTDVTIGEGALLSGEGGKVGHDLALQLDILLDQMSALSAPARYVMADVLIADSNASELTTLELRPSTSARLYARLRRGECLAGKVLDSGRAFANPVQPERQTSIGTCAVPLPG